MQLSTCEWAVHMCMLGGADLSDVAGCGVILDQQAPLPGSAPQACDRPRGRSNAGGRFGACLGARLGSAQHSSSEPHVGMPTLPQPKATGPNRERHRRGVLCPGTPVEQPHAAGVYACCWAQEEVEGVLKPKAGLSPLGLSTRRVWLGGGWTALGRGRRVRAGHAGERLIWRRGMWGC